MHSFLRQLTPLHAACEPEAGSCWNRAGRGQGAPSPSPKHRQLEKGHGSAEAVLQPIADATVS